jgi:hypothetical protein
LFSAAVPYQGGTDHVNEQWPDVWVRLFQKRGFGVSDCVRRRIWENEAVQGFYAQNSLLFATSEYLESRPTLKREFDNTTPTYLSVVHPRRYLDTIQLMRRFHITGQEIGAIVPPGSSFLLVDDGYLRTLEQQFQLKLVTGREPVPFLERDGRYWGLPGDDATAIRELERMRGAAVEFVVFAWPSIWWLEHYTEFRDYLRTRFPCVCQNERLIAFDVREVRAK